MELRKVIIDGKEYYEAVESESAADNKSAEKHSDCGFREVSDKICEGAKKLGAKVKAGADELGVAIKEDAKDFCEGAKEFGTKVADTAKDIGKKTAVAAKDFGIKTAEVAKEVGKKTVEVGGKVKAGAKAAGEKIKDGAERLFARDKSLDPNSKEAKLIKLLPYMSRKETREAAARLLENDEAIMRVDLSAILPFLSGEDCNAIFLRSIELGKRSIELSTVMQYVDASVLSTVVDGYLEGKYPKLNIDEFYPFLEDLDIKRIFDYIIGE